MNKLCAKKEEIDTKPRLASCNAAQALAPPQAVESASVLTRRRRIAVAWIAVAIIFMVLGAFIAYRLHTGIS